MCDIRGEKRKIDALLERAARAAPANVRADESALAEFCMITASEYYSTECPDECLRRRCADFAARVMRRETADAWRATMAKRRSPIAQEKA
ncbi:hypothetical protein IY145_16975 [Methylosinus sp. H3A]|uniref:hypothetical protein n=1 Tax=Methylosinus sp. H3A TaxID=2785786 RepID=UPI0018C28F9F|nr:hypothetical protein [Methylosinus sp. H3A]MBG0811066.1 hypothetical protein [Methylosinus sp. H3A]